MSRRNIYLAILAGTCLCFGDINRPVMADPPVNPPVTCISLGQELAAAQAELARLETELFECQLDEGNCTLIEMAIEAQRIVIQQILDQMTEMGCFPA